jgi:hypothetical protein
VFALAVAACGSPTTPTAAPATPSESWNPARDVVDQGEAVWKVQQPGAFAYTIEMTGGPLGDGAGARYRVASLEGHPEALFLNGTADPPLDGADVGIPALFDAIGAAYDAGADVTVDIDPTYGYPRSASVTGSTPETSWSATIEELAVAGSPASTAITQDAMEKMRDHWPRTVAGDWAYTWSRFRAKDGPDVATTWNVRWEGDKLHTSSESEAAGVVPSDTATPTGTLDLIQHEFSAGAWADLSTDSDSGDETLIAIDPSPTVDGDGYFIRISFTDLQAKRARSAQASAAKRWSRNEPTVYTYTWHYSGAGKDLDYKVSVDGNKVSIKALNGSPPAKQAWVSPRIKDTLAMLGDVLDQDGIVVATYDKKLGYPVKARMTPHGDAGREGTITITAFQAP